MVYETLLATNFRDKTGDFSIHIYKEMKRKKEIYSNVYNTSIVMDKKKLTGSDARKTSTVESSDIHHNQSTIISAHANDHSK